MKILGMGIWLWRILRGLYAIYPHEELWLSDDVPTLIRGRQDPKRLYATAIRFDVMEEYLLGLVERHGEDRS